MHGLEQNVEQLVSVELSQDHIGSTLESFWEQNRQWRRARAMCLKARAEKWRNTGVWSREVGCIFHDIEALYLVCLYSVLYAQSFPAAAQSPQRFLTLYCLGVIPWLLIGAILCCVVPRLLAHRANQFEMEANLISNT